MPLLPDDTATCSKLVQEIITAVKGDSDFWNNDPLERAKPEYKGFRSIRNNRLTRDFVEGDFPVLFIDGDENLATQLNAGIVITTRIPVFQVTDLYVEDDDALASIKHKIEILFMSVLNTFELHNADKILMFEDVLGNFKTSNITTRIALC